MKFNVKSAEIAPGGYNKNDISLNIEASVENANSMIDTVGEYYGDKFILHNLLNNNGKEAFMKDLDLVLSEYE